MKLITELQPRMIKLSEQKIIFWAVFRKPNFNKKTAQHTSFTVLNKEPNVFKEFDLHYLNLAALAHEHLGDTLPETFLKNYVSSVMQQPEAPLAPIQRLKGLQGLHEGWQGPMSYYNCNFRLKINIKCKKWSGIKQYKRYGQMERKKM